MMPEFTYDGVVRYAYGFYNPNHAAALLCAILPFLLAWLMRPRLWEKIAAGILTATLFVLLALTYSRTGLLVAALEAILFAVPHIKSKRFVLYGCGAGIVFALIIWLSGAWGRFTIDNALLNRGDIWQAACDLAIANPWGTGGGNSGLLATNFLLPPGIACRTMVNSHLTLIAEYGIIPGFLWVTGISYALLAGWSRSRSAWLSFFGLVLSAWFSSVFDWQVLWDIKNYGGLSLSNYVLSWATLLLFIGMGVYLAWGKMRWRSLAMAGGIGVLSLGVMMICARAGAPRLEQGIVVKQGEEIPLVLYDSTWEMADALWFLREYMPGSGYRLPLASVQHAEVLPPSPSGQVILQGECAHFYDEYATQESILVSPPEYMEIPPKIRALYWKRYADSNRVKRRAERLGIPVIVYD